MSDDDEEKIADIATRIAKSKKAVIATDHAVDLDLHTRRFIHEAQLEFMVCIPLVPQHETIAVLYGDRRQASTDTTSQGEERVITHLANLAAAALENARMFERASNDPLTGLPNSSHFLLKLATVMREASQESPAGILLLDLDSFKKVNDVAGAEMGDRALTDIAQTLQEVLRADGLVARYGSDKFAILLPADSEIKIALRLYDVAERARASVRTKAYHDVRMSASIGGVSFPGPQIQGAPDIVALADDLLNKARARGQGQVEIKTEWESSD